MGEETKQMYQIIPKDVTKKKRNARNKNLMESKAEYVVLGKPRPRREQGGTMDARIMTI